MIFTTLTNFGVRLVSQSGNRMNLNSHCKVMRQVTDHRWMNLYIIHELKHILNFNFVGGKDLSGCEHPRVCLLNHNR